MGKTKKMLCYKYLPPVCVVPMPDGANVEGPNRASGHFVLDLRTESDFRDMYLEKGADGRPILSGNPEEIIKEARSLNFDSRMIPLDLMSRIGAINLAKTNNGDKKMPVVVPIIRCYFDHEHVWIANGTTVIYHIKDKYQSYMSDLVKWSSHPDGNRWFAMSATRASKRLAWGVNIWYNGMIDLAMYMMNPTRVINTRVLEDPNNIDRGPRSDIKVNMNPQQAVSYLTPPTFPSELFGLGEILQSMHSSANAQVQSVRQGQAGLVRGGMNALEEMLATSTGRQFLASIILKSGGMKSMAEKALLKKQLLIPEEGESFVEPAYDPATGQKKYEEQSVTLDDMRHVFRMEIDLPAARLNSAAEFASKTAFFDRAEKHIELFDVRALYEEMTDDYDMIRRVMLPEEVVKERQTRMAEAQMRAKEAEAIVPQRQPPTQAPAGQGEQGMMGAVQPMMEQ
jgi:hypothetical protein